MSRVTLALGLALLALESAAAIWILVGASANGTSGTAIALALTAGVTFVCSGLVALARRPENRTGAYLMAVGYLWFLAALTDSENTWLFTIGFALGNLIWVPFTALVLAYPSGQLQTRLERAIPVLSGVLLTGTATAVLLLNPDPAPTRCDECPGSAIDVADKPGLADAFDTAGTIAGLALIAIVVTILVRKWRRATPALRRLLWPVLGSGSATLLSVALLVIADQVSSGVAEPLQLLFFLSFASVPLAFLFGILRTRLARSSVTDVVVALQAGAPIREALADALNDPSLELVYRRAASAQWVDADGHRVPEPKPSPGRAVTLVERTGLPIAALVHDDSLSEAQDLLDAVAAAAALSLQNERLQAELRAQVEILTTIADTVPSLLVNIDTDGRISNQNRAAVIAAGARDEEELRGRFFWDVFIDPDERADVIERFQALAPTFAAGEYENSFTNQHGDRRVIAWRAAPVVGQDGRVESIVAGGIDITDRHRLEEEKELERRFLNAIANDAPSLLCLIDETGLVAPGATNKAFERILDYDPAETGGHRFWERYVDPAEAADVRASIEHVIGGGKSEEHDHHWVTSRGERLLIAWSCTALPQVDERTMFLISGVDITERKHRELELQRERDATTTVLQTISSVVAVLGRGFEIRDRDVDNPLAAVNQAFRETLWWRDEELVGRDFLGLLPNDDGRAHAALAGAAAGAASSVVESDWLRADGQTVTFEWNASPVADVTGRTDGLVLVSGVDVTERKVRERELRASEERLRAVIAGAPVAIVEVDLDDTVKQWNPAAERMFGWPAEEALGNLVPMIPPDRETEFRRLLEQVRGGQAYTGYETVRRRRDGSLIDVEISAAPIRDAHGGVVGHIAVIGDISDRKRHEQEVRASRARLVAAGDDARRRLERNLHDGAQQRLVALSVSLRLAESRLLTDAEAAVTILASAREELAHALEELRELARGIHPAVLTDRGLTAAVDALVGRSPVHVDTDLPDDRLPPAVEAAAYYVIAEALTNVAKYASARSVTVQVETHDGIVEVTVSDDGVGGADPLGGSGLRGLADRVAALDGTLSVESPSGGGTCVRAEIPVRAAVPTT